MKKIGEYILTILLSGLIMNSGAALAETQTQDEFQMSGRIEGYGTHFEVNNSEYINITLDSSVPVGLVLSSVPEMITIRIEADPVMPSAIITISGFLPSTAYHRYEDDYHNHTVFTTDESGNYTYTQDISAQHLVLIQPRSSTKFINDSATGGDCTSFGTWDSTSKTCSLTMDVSETIQIDSDRVILAGNGHTLTAVNRGGNGIYLYGREGIIVKDLNIYGFSYGVGLYNSDNNVLSTNTLSGSWLDIYLFNSAGNSILNSTVSGGSWSGIYLENSNGNTIKNNTANWNHIGGIDLWGSNNNTIEGNRLFENRYYGYGKGVYLLWSNSNILRGNTVFNNDNGFHLRGSSNNLLSDNTVIDNNYSWTECDIRPGECWTFSGGSGIYLDSFLQNSINNVIYNNYFDNNINVGSNNHANIWNITRTSGMNIIGGPYVGGNFWANPDGTGFSQICTVANRDGICDTSYIIDSNNIDYLPLSMNFTQDTLPPITTLILSGTNGNNGWYISNVQVSLTSVDNDGGSGVNTTEYSIDGNDWYVYTGQFNISNEGTTIVYYRSTDKTGNVESAKNQTVKIDKTPPVLMIRTPISGGIYILNQILVADWSAHDSTSGIESATGTVPNGSAIDTGTPGAKIFNLSAVDSAGNIADLSVPYNIIYNFTGILMPIRSDGSSIFKSGSTVPVKFRITDAYGNYVNTAVASLTYQKITDDILGTIEEPISTSAADNGNTFRYDSIDNLYIFNLGTSGMDRGTYQLNIDLDDGTVYNVRISVRL